MFTTRVCHINVALPDVTLRPVKGVMEQRPRPAIQLNQIAAIPIILEQVINELDPRFPKVQSMMLRVAKNKEMLIRPRVPVTLPFLLRAQ